jgi:hypothetical protein
MQMHIGLVISHSVLALRYRHCLLPISPPIVLDLPLRYSDIRFGGRRRVMSG